MEVSCTTAKAGIIEAVVSDKTAWMEDCAIFTSVT
ncbi:hypothetical protein CJA_2799 [Cellvibrio japonicus Ueda107]|uniref:Uncharacterized protein n=1 Tax=Cellvibrio japonicus (strain Ueda107) TaxID=498211 RepID=B3PBY8_CELJU|nr:hypothetical protein CJA_2799 [Cellvibrio japonicus Ueda107]